MSDSTLKKNDTAAQKLGAAHTPGPWQLWTSNSWRRFASRDHGMVCEPIVHSDGHPDLYFFNGGVEGPDARLIAAAPDLLAMLEELAQMAEDDAVLFNGDSAWRPFYLVHRDKIRAAIAKAKGEA